MRVKEDEVKRIQCGQKSKSKLLEVEEPTVGIKIFRPDQKDVVLPVIKLSKAATRYDYWICYRNNAVQITVQKHIGFHLPPKNFPDLVQVRCPSAIIVIFDVIQHLRTVFNLYQKVFLFVLVPLIQRD